MSIKKTKLRTKEKYRKKRIFIIIEKKIRIREKIIRRRR
jgi:hypothetical protein